MDQRRFAKFGQFQSVLERGAEGDGMRNNKLKFNSAQVQPTTSQNVQLRKRQIIRMTQPAEARLGLGRVEQLGPGGGLPPREPPAEIQK